MNENAKTGLYIGAAAALAVIAVFSSPGTAEPEFFSDVGEEFFEGFTDPGKATSLEVWEVDAEVGEAIPFNVKQEKGRWLIPSHYDYPADAENRMSDAAALLVGLTKASVRSDSKEDHASFGVVDPTEQSLAMEGRGKRVTFKDEVGRVLADLIIGKEVEDHAGMRYVRIPEKKRTYTAKIATELSTKFEDWIERDLLGVSSVDIKKLVFDNYSVDEKRGALVPGEKLVVEKDGDAWKINDLKDGEEINEDKRREAAETLAELKIVGVRQKPEGLTARLERSQGIEREILATSLQRKGFFLSRGKLYSNDGDLLAMDDKGTVYTLRFGEVVYGSGSVVTSGQQESGRKKIGEQGDGGADVGPKEEKGTHRYLMITAHFDEALLGKPDGEPLSKEQLDKRKIARQDLEDLVAAVEKFQGQNDKKLPENLADLTVGDDAPLKELKKDPWERDYVYAKADEGFTIRSLADDGSEGGSGAGSDVVSDKLSAEDDLTRISDDHEAHKKKVEEGEKRAEGLTTRFGPWYYVIDGEAFSKLHLGRAELVKKKADDKAPAAEQSDKK
ncbi:MAG: DUF4340 domain-containing protein [Planctomycetota bacterium]|jgi:uncharacterized protein YbcI|nr:DUF4340 domain-containing protein [Planctomycetota bacterium]